MRTLLICHADAPLDYEGLARWLASFSTLSGIVLLEETRERSRKRIRRELERVGALRFADVLAFRLYYTLFLAAGDRAWAERALGELRARYPEPAEVPVLRAHSPNTPEAEAFIRGARPDVVLARCKTLIKESVFSIPRCGTFVMHPGICPEYRNAHGCFWALVNDDRERVGMTLLRIDKGVDTGPVYGHYSYPYDEVNESHIVIQNRVVLENLPVLEAKFKEIQAGEAQPLEVNGRASAIWGQPWLTWHLRWKRGARRRA